MSNTLKLVTSSSPNLNQNLIVINEVETNSSVQSLTQENTLKSFIGERVQNRNAIVSTGGSLHFFCRSKFGARIIFRKEFPEPDLAGDTMLRNAMYDG